MGKLLVLLVFLGVFYIVLALINAAVNEHLRKISYEKRHGHFYYAVLLLLLAVLFFLVGIAMLAAVFSAGETFAFMFSLILLCAAVLAWRHYRSSQNQFWLHLAATLGMTLSAVLLLIVAF